VVRVEHGEQAVDRVPDTGTHVRVGRQDDRRHRRAGRNGRGADRHCEVPVHPVVEGVRVLREGADTSVGVARGSILPEGHTVRADVRARRLVCREEGATTRARALGNDVEEIVVDAVERSERRSGGERRSPVVRRLLVAVHLGHDGSSGTQVVMVHSNSRSTASVFERESNVSYAMGTFAGSNGLERSVNRPTSDSGTVVYGE
jgi:hypothetical protein